MWPAGLHDASQRTEAIKAFAGGITRNDAEAINVGGRGAKAGTRQYVTLRRMRMSRRTRKSSGLFLEGYTRAILASIATSPFVQTSITGQIRRTISSFYDESQNNRSWCSARRSLHIGFRANLKRPVGQAFGSWRSSQADQRPADFLLAIANGDQMSRQGRWQCYDDFDKQLRGGLLGWDPRRTLHIDLLRVKSRRRSKRAPLVVAGVALPQTL
jgi:hypothetical protein